MENEKKPGNPSGENQGNKRNRPHRRRGYFIDPAQGGKEQERSAPAEKSAEQKSAREQEDKRKPTAPRPDAPQNRSEDATKREDPAQNHKKKHKRHRPSGHNKPKEATENAEPRKEPQESAKKNQPSHKNDRNRNQKQDRNSSSGNQQRNNRSSDKLILPKEEKKPLPLSADDEYEEVFFPAEEEPAKEPAAPAKEEAPAPMVKVAGIRFKNSGKVYYFDPGKLVLKRGDFAIVETARGPEYGEVAMGNTMVKESDTVPPLRPVIRIATNADRVHHEDNKKKEEESLRICNEKIQAHGLDMKLIDAQYTFDNSKLLFYFTSAGRVDFRDLVKDLASVFRTRIELRQIGIRDEAKLMGGMGMCGRPLCCSLFLSDFGQVSIKMAKEQNLSLNSAKISGICGRLMCCLRYEHEAYEYEIKRTPPVDSTVRTADGNGTVTEINPLVGTIKVRLFASPETPPKTYRREDVIMLRKKNGKQEKNDKSDK